MFALEMQKYVNIKMEKRTFKTPVEQHYKLFQEEPLKYEWVRKTTFETIRISEAEFQH